MLNAEDLLTEEELDVERRFLVEGEVFPISWDERVYDEAVSVGAAREFLSHEPLMFRECWEMLMSAAAVCNGKPVQLSDPYHVKIAKGFIAGWRSRIDRGYLPETSGTPPTS